MNLLRAFATVGGLTMISRVLGFVRDILIAAVLGTGAVADAFFVAFRFPNLFRRLFAEGAFNAAFVPLFAKRLESQGRSAARAFAEDALSVLLTALLIVTAIAEISMPWLMYVIAPGFADTPDKFDLAVLLTRIAFPYLLCMSLVALLSGVLNALGRFAAAAAAPIILNIVLISVMAFAAIADVGDAAIAGQILAWGVCAAGFLQLFALLWACTRANMRPSLTWPRLTPGVKRLVVLGIPGVIAAGIIQINLLIGTIIASLQDSAVSFLYYADRIYQLPLGVVGIAIGIVLLPDLSRRLRAGDNSGALNGQNRSLEFSALLTLPAAVALFMVPGPIVQVLFERGAFDASDRIATSGALAAFAVGLPAFVLIKVFSPGFFAREDTRTPMYFAAAGVAVNVALSLALFFIIGHIGIAIATSVAGWVNAVLLGVTLHRRGHYQTDAQLRRRLPRILLASLLMGLAVWLLAGALDPFFEPNRGLAAQVVALAVLVGGGLLIYGTIVHLTGGANLRAALAQLRRRPSAPIPPSSDT